MAEQFLTLMADFEQPVQEMMGGWYEKLQEAGFDGVQTHGLPYHISIATFPLDQEQEAIEHIRKLAETFAPIEMHMSHMGIFPGGKVLFAAPEWNEKLRKLREGCSWEKEVNGHIWTPHATIMMEEPERICAALPILIRHFRPFVGKLTRLHLCAFWPTREILSVDLAGKQ